LFIPAGYPGRSCDHLGLNLAQNVIIEIENTSREPADTMEQPNLPYAVIAKPMGPDCNLDCRYCFYLEKKNLFDAKVSHRMSGEVLEDFIRQYIESQNVPEIHFAWQGGEPTLLGVDYFKEAVGLQKKNAAGKRVTNSIQTNGTLIDDKWCEFLRANDFLVGLSIDGPARLHDRYRVDRKGRSSFARVMGAVDLLIKHGTRFNTLTVVNDANSRHPLELYRFLKEISEGFIQFIPLVERSPGKTAKGLGMNLDMPPAAEAGAGPPLKSWSVTPRRFGEFYVQIFDEWVRQDVGRVFVQFFDVALGNWMGSGSGLCQFAPTCGHSGLLEHNGDLYTCDHYVYPQYRLGNIFEKPLKEMIASERKRRFNRFKQSALTPYCRECSVLFACHGDCPKHRFRRTPDGEPGLSYLCTAYRRIFSHMDPLMRIMAQMVRGGGEAAGIMAYLAETDRQKQFKTAGRNDPCPCGSGRKYKKCCGNAP